MYSSSLVMGTRRQPEGRHPTQNPHMFMYVLRLRRDNERSGHCSLTVSGLGLGSWHLPSLATLYSPYSCIRTASYSLLIRCSHTVAHASCRCITYTYTVADAARVIRHISARTETCTCIYYCRACGCTCHYIDNTRSLRTPQTTTYNTAVMILLRAGFWAGVDAKNPPILVLLQIPLGQRTLKNRTYMIS